MLVSGSQFLCYGRERGRNSLGLGYVEFRDVALEQSFWRFMLVVYVLYALA